MPLAWTKSAIDSAVGCATHARPHLSETRAAAAESPPGVTVAFRDRACSILQKSLRDQDDGATLDELREAVEILESVAPVWTRVLGEAHPETPMVQGALATARASAPPAAGSAEEKS